MCLHLEQQRVDQFGGIGCWIGDELESKAVW